MIQEAVLSIIIVRFFQATFDLKEQLVSLKKEVPFSMAIVNVKFMHECFPNHSCMGAARIK